MIHSNIQRFSFSLYISDEELVRCRDPEDFADMWGDKVKYLMKEAVHDTALAAMWGEDPQTPPNWNKEYVVCLLYTSPSPRDS